MDKLFFKGARESVQIECVASCPADNGREVKIKFKARFRCPNQTERKEIAEGAMAGSIKDDDVIDKLLIGWDGVLDASDEPIPYSKEMVEEAMNFPPYREALVNGALQLVFGREFLRAKNSQRQGAGG